MATIMLGQGSDGPFITEVQSRKTSDARQTFQRSRMPGCIGPSLRQKTALLCPFLK
jgi:hypothetical protein